jgi:hypothetical protein
MSFYHYPYERRFSFFAVFDVKPPRTKDPRKTISPTGLHLRLSNTKHFPLRLPWERGVSEWGSEVAALLRDEWAADRLQVLFDHGGLEEHLWVAPPFTQRWYGAGLEPVPKTALQQLLETAPHIQTNKGAGKAKQRLWQRWGAMVSRGMAQTPGPLPGTRDDWAPAFKAWLMQPTPDWASIDTVLAQHPDWIMATRYADHGVPALAKVPDGAGRWLDEEGLWSTFLARGGDPTALIHLPDDLKEKAYGIHTPARMPVWWACAQKGSAAAGAWGDVHDPDLAAQRRHHGYFQGFQEHEYKDSHPRLGPNGEVGRGYADEPTGWAWKAEKDVMRKNLLRHMTAPKDWMGLNAGRHGSLHQPGWPHPIWLAIEALPSLLGKEAAEAPQEAGEPDQALLLKLLRADGGDPLARQARNAQGANLWLTMYTIEYSQDRTTALAFLNEQGIGPEADPAGNGMLMHLLPKAWDPMAPLTEEAHLNMIGAERRTELANWMPHRFEALVGTTAAAQDELARLLWRTASASLTLTNVPDLFKQVSPTTPMSPLLRGSLVTLLTVGDVDPRPWLEQPIVWPDEATRTALYQKASQSLGGAWLETARQHAHVIAAARAQASLSRPRSRG